ncbi:MAG: alpha/beta fold hydrolase [Acetobacterium sp.]
MQYKTFGNKNNPAMVFLHGGALSWWSWKKQIDFFQKDYFVVAAIIDGHGDDWETPFISIENSAEKLLAYINENCGGRVFAICGLSIGAQIVVEILSLRTDLADYAVIESALVVPIKKTVDLMSPLYKLSYKLIKKRWFAKLQAKTLNVPEDLFENYFVDSSRMSKESLINMIKSNGSYAIPNALGNTKAKTLILVGEKELGIMKKSAFLINKMIPVSTIKVITKSGHGDISLNDYKAYNELLNQFFASQKLTNL